MTVSLAKSLIYCLFAVCVAAAAGAAETRAPIRLIPPDTPPPAETKPEPEQREPQRAPSAVQTVLSAPAAPSDPDSAGLPGFEGGFGLPLWRDSSKAAVARLLEGLPQTVASPALKGVLFRVLAAGAAPPEGEGPRLAPLRVRQLQNLGRDKEAAQLAGAAGLEAPGAAVGSEAVDPSLVSGDLDTACVAADAEMMRAPSAYVQRAAAFCAAKAGDVDRARLILDILREVDAGGDLLFEGLMLRAMDAEAGGAPPLPDDGPVTPLNVAMLAWLNEAPPEVWSLRSDPAARRVRAGIVRTDAEAEDAARNGQIAPKALLARYLRPSDTEHPRALLARAAVEAEDPKEKLQALVLLWKDSVSAGLLRPLASATVDLAAGIEPSTEMAPHTGWVVLAALAGGRLDIAERWYAAAVERGAALEADSLRAALAWPLMKLAGAGDSVSGAEDGLRRWLEADGGDSPKPDAVMLLALMEAMGEPVGRDEWAALLTELGSVTVEAPAPVVWRGLDAAGRGGRIGEAVLYAVIASGGRARADVPTAVAVARALASVGLAAEARAYALECLIETAAP